MCALQIVRIIMLQRSINVFVGVITSCNLRIVRADEFVLSLRLAKPELLILRLLLRTTGYATPSAMMLLRRCL